MQDKRRAKRVRFNLPTEGERRGANEEDAMCGPSIETVICPLHGAVQESRHCKEIKQHSVITRESISDRTLALNTEYLKIDRTNPQECIIFCQKMTQLYIDKGLLEIGIQGNGNNVIMDHETEEYSTAELRKDIKELGDYRRSDKLKKLINEYLILRENYTNRTFLREKNAFSVYVEMVSASEDLSDQIEQMMLREATEYVISQKYSESARRVRNREFEINFLFSYFSPMELGCIFETE